MDGRYLKEDELIAPYVPNPSVLSILSVCQHEILTSAFIILGDLISKTKLEFRRMMLPSKDEPQIQLKIVNACEVSTLASIQKQGSFQISALTD